MKKTISLLLTTLLIASLAIMPVSASTDVEINADANLEEGLSLGDLTTSSYPQFRATQGNVNSAYNDAQGNSGKGKWGVKVIEDPENPSNKMFELDAGTSNTGWFGHKLSLYDPFVGGMVAVKRFTVRIKLPVTSNTNARTTVFGQSDKANDNYVSSHQNQIIVFKNGGAYYYDSDATTPEDVSFLNEGESIAAEKWYKVEAVLDARKASTGKVYMNGFVYDEAENKLIGTTGWQVVKVAAPTQGKLSNWATDITAYGYDKGDVVLIDEFKAYEITDIPTYSITDETGAAFTEGGLLPTSNNPVLTFTYSNPIPAAAVNSDNIKLCYNDTELSADMYTVSAGESDANGNTTSFTVTMSDLSPETPYAIRLMAAISDYNESSASFAGVPADCGLYKDFAFVSPKDPFVEAISALTFTENEGKVSAATTISNTMLVDREYMFIITSWNKDLECVAIKNVYGTLAAGTSAEVNLPEVAFEDAESTVCVYLVDNWYDMKPIGDPKVYKRS